MEILNWKIVKNEEKDNWIIKLNTKEFGWIDEKQTFKTFVEAGKYLQKHYSK